MTKPTVDRIAAAAELSCFYVTPAGTWLRIQYCDMEAGVFGAVDENSFEEYSFTFDELAESDNIGEFHKLTKMDC
jgi:hypothetical protein